MSAFEQMNKRLARIEAEILIVLAAMIAQLGGLIALFLKKGG